MSNTGKATDAIDSMDQARRADLLGLVNRLERAIFAVEQATNGVKEFSTIAAAARQLGIGQKALRAAIRRGEVPVYALGTKSAGRPRVHIPEVRDWALSTQVDPFEAIRQSGKTAARRVHRSKSGVQ